jgi:hypothetical protein
MLSDVFSRDNEAGMLIYSEAESLIETTNTDS